MFFVLVTRDQPGGVEELEFIRNPITRPWSLVASTSRQRSHASEACDLWKEVDTAKLQGLVMGFLMNGNSSTPPS